MQNSDGVLKEFCVLLYFLNVQCCHNFHFKISRTCACHLAATDVATLSWYLACRVNILSLVMALIYGTNHLSSPYWALASPYWDLAWGCSNPALGFSLGLVPSLAAMVRSPHSEKKRAGGLWPHSTVVCKGVKAATPSASWMVLAMLQRKLALVIWPCTQRAQASDPAVL